MTKTCRGGHRPPDYVDFKPFFGGRPMVAPTTEFISNSPINTNLTLFIPMSSDIFKNFEVSFGVEMETVAGVVFSIEITAGVFEA